MRMIITTKNECTIFLNDFREVKFKIPSFEYSINSGTSWVSNPNDIDISRSLMVSDIKQEKDASGFTTIHIECGGYTNCVLVIHEESKSYKLIIAESDTRILCEMIPY